jgi:hypothetical protein
MRLYRILCVVLATVLLCGGLAYAGPFSILQSWVEKPYPMPTGQSREWNQKPLVVQPQSWPDSTQESTSLPQQSTVLAPLPGTGSPSPIGAPEREKLPLLPGHNPPINAPSTEGLIAGLVPAITGAMRPGQQQVVISLAATEATSERFVRISILLEVLLWLALLSIGLLMIYAVGTYMQSAAQRANGRRSADMAALLAQIQTHAGQSSTPVNSSPTGSQAVASSTSKPGI